MGNKQTVRKADVTLDEVVKAIETEDFQWAVCREKGGGSYTAYVSEIHDIYIADSLAGGLMCESGATPAEALQIAFNVELGHRATRRANR